MNFGANAKVTVILLTWFV